MADKVEDNKVKIKGVVYGLLPVDFIDTVGTSITKYFAGQKKEEVMKAIVENAKKRGWYFNKQNQLCLPLEAREIKFMQVEYDNTTQVI